MFLFEFFQLDCDFEDGTQCGWFNYFHDDFDWIKKSGPSNDLLPNNGPSYDHTLGKFSRGLGENPYKKASLIIALTSDPLYFAICSLKSGQKVMFTFNLLPGLF